MPSDYYDYLGVDRDVSSEEIEAAYREAVKERHPDAGGSDVEMQALTAAREVLSSEKSRYVYDRKGHRAYVEQFGGVLFDADSDGDGGPSSWERVSSVSTPDPEPEDVPETESESESGSVGDDESGEDSTVASDSNTTVDDSTVNSSNNTRARWHTTGVDSSGSTTTKYDYGFDDTSSGGERRFSASPFELVFGFFASFPSLVVVLLAAFVAAVPVYGVGKYVFETGLWQTTTGYGALLVAVFLGTAVVVSYVSAVPRSSDTHARPYFTSVFLAMTALFILPFIWVSPTTGFAGVAVVKATYLFAAGVVATGLFYGGLLTVFFEHDVSRWVYAWGGAIAPAVFVVSVLLGYAPVQLPVFADVPGVVSSVSSFVVVGASYATVVGFVSYGLTVIIMAYEWLVIATN